MMLRTTLPNLLLLTVLVGTPLRAAAQLEVTAGTIVRSDPLSEGVRVGPALAVSTVLWRLPAILEIGVARTDFSSLGQAYHDDHYSVAILGSWQVVRGRTSLALRLGIGAWGEDQTVETDPPMDGGSNWAETVTPGLSLRRTIGPDTDLVFTVSDAILGPLNAIFDPEEYGVEHRVRILVGVRF